MLIATKMLPGKYARRSAQMSRPMRATWPRTPADGVESSVTVRHRRGARREAHREQPRVHRGLQQLKLRAVLNRLVPAVVPMPRERALVEVRAAGAPLERLESRIGLPFGVEEGRRK